MEKVNNKQISVIGSNALNLGKVVNWEKFINNNIFQFFISSDYHLNHDSDFLHIQRGYSNYKDMTEAVIQNHNSVVGKDDFFLALGDMFMNRVELLDELLPRLNGKWFISRGNHTSLGKMNRILELRPDWIKVDEAFNIRIKDNEFSFTHYPLQQSKLNANRGASPKSPIIYSLYGHTHEHSSGWTEYNNYHIGVDGNNLYPHKFSDIYKELKDVKDFSSRPV